jgi:DNA-binding NtrC family response regulator
MKEFKILLVDDEEDFVKTLAERLSLKQVGQNKPGVALTGEAALQSLESEVPDVMVLDLRMPGIDGLEVLKNVKQHYPDVQVVILTGHGSDKDREEAERLGAFDYLEKPVNIDTLVTSIRKALAQKWDESMVAATFAEAGEFDSAEKYLKEK